MKRYTLLISLFLIVGFAASAQAGVAVQKIVTPKSTLSIPAAPQLKTHPSEPASDDSQLCKRCRDCEAGFEDEMECQNVCKNMFGDCCKDNSCQGYDSPEYNACYKKNKECIIDCHTRLGKDPICAEDMNAKYCERAWVNQHCR